MFVSVSNYFGVWGLSWFLYSLFIQVTITEVSFVPGTMVGTRDRAVIWTNFSLVELMFQLVPMGCLWSFIVWPPRRFGENHTNLLFGFICVGSTILVLFSVSPQEVIFCFVLLSLFGQKGILMTVLVQKPEGWYLSFYRSGLNAVAGEHTWNIKGKVPRRTWADPLFAQSVASEHFLAVAWRTTF